ncbi:hypothetical protein C2S52_019853 [Perilla frutescens var. hirtella]|nr:hypothetical protein C2S52_019853 [Perilla frutescens var. hirtella]
MGERPYALDKYFHSRIIAQSDCTHKYQKGLDIVLGKESAVLILDDTCTEANLGFNYSSLSQLRTDEGALPTVLKILQQIHSLFFDKDNLEERDVRQVILSSRLTLRLSSIPCGWRLRLPTIYGTKLSSYSFKES